MDGDCPLHGPPGTMWAPSTWSDARIKREGGEQSYCVRCKRWVYANQWPVDADQEAADG